MSTKETKNLDHTNLFGHLKNHIKEPTVLERFERGEEIVIDMDNIHSDKGSSNFIEQSAPKYINLDSEIQKLVTINEYFNQIIKGSIYKGHENMIKNAAESATKKISNIINEYNNDTNPNNEDARKKLFIDIMGVYSRQIFPIIDIINTNILFTNWDNKALDLGKIGITFPEYNDNPNDIRLKPHYNIVKTFDAPAGVNQRITIGSKEDYNRRLKKSNLRRSQK